MKDLIRDIKISIVEGKYKCISVYKIPNDIEKWENCKICGLKPLTWKYNNGESTACGCGENEYKHFSIYSESIMYVSTIHYDRDKLRKNWNHWVQTQWISETVEKLNLVWK